MTTDPFTEAARAEAEERLTWHDQQFGSLLDPMVHMAVWARDHLATQGPTDAEVEAVARYLYKTQTGSDLIDTSIYRQDWLRIARAALEAVAARRDEESR